MDFSNTMLCWQRASGSVPLVRSVKMPVWMKPGQTAFPPVSLFQYKVRKGDDLFALAARLNIAYDALVTDVIMPAMSGPTLADRIAVVRSGMPVLFMSGYEADALPAGAPRPLAKPFSGRDLTSAVAALFGREA